MEGFTLVGWVVEGLNPEGVSYRVGVDRLGLKLERRKIDPSVGWVAVL